MYFLDWPIAKFCQKKLQIVMIESKLLPPPSWIYGYEFKSNLRLFPVNFQFKFMGSFCSVCAIKTFWEFDSQWELFYFLHSILRQSISYSGTNLVLGT